MDAKRAIYTAALPWKEEKNMPGRLPARPARPHRRRVFAYVPIVELVERRRLLAASVSNGVLTINGDDVANFSDTIELRQTALNSRILRVLINGVSAGTFAMGTLTRV